MSKREKPFNNPFGDLKLKAPVPEPKPLVPAKPRNLARPEPVTDDEAALFLAAVGEVQPVRGKDRVPPPPPQAKAKTVDPDEEALIALSELVSGDRPLDLADSDEYIEGSIQGLDRGIVKRLRAGDYAVQAHLDLHGLTRAEAKPALERFVDKARLAGHRCVLVVHGRGLHSKDSIPVLKEGLQLWLSRGRIARQVLAFTSARPHDGGAGAVYVLLRR